MFLHVAALASYDGSDDGVTRGEDGERVSMMHGAVSMVSRIEGEEEDMTHQEMIYSRQSMLPPYASRQ